MPFIHPVIFWSGLGAVSLPIIIHLLNRRRFRILDWAAMRFLLESLRKNRRRLRVEELILLALRCLLILLLGSAVARFTGCEAMEILPAGQSTRTAVFILDDSYSMGQKYGAGTVFSAATSDLTQRIEATGQTDTVAIILASRAEVDRTFFGPNFVTDAESLISRLKALKPSDRRVRLADSLATAEKIFKEDKAGTRRLYVLSDFRKVDLTGRDEAEAIRRHFAALRDLGVEVIAMDYGIDGTRNLTIESVELLDDFAVANIPMRLGVTVRNHGRRRAENVQVGFAQQVKTPEGYNEVNLPIETIEAIDVGQSRRVEFVVTCRRPGSTVFTASLPADELPGDNVAHLALDVRASLRALLVDGRPGITRRSDGESYFLNLAMDPKSDSASGVRTTIVTAEQLPGVNFYDYDLVALLNVAAMAPGSGEEGEYPQLTALEHYVRDGGGLVIFTGEQVDLTFYNGPLWNGGAGLSPFRIRSPKGDPKRKDEYFRLQPKSIVPEGPMRFFAGKGAELTTLIRVFAFTPADEHVTANPKASVGPPRVLARFTDDNSSPAIVSRKYGKGVVTMFYTTASLRWTDWPQDIPRTIFINPMQDLVRYVARRQKEEFTALVGEPVVFEVTGPLREATGKLKTPRFPAAPMVTLLPAAAEGRNMLRFERAWDAGVYTLGFDIVEDSSEVHQDVLFARNADPVEGELTPGHRPDIASAFGTDDFIYRQRKATGTSSIVQAEAEKEYWIYMMAAVLALLCLETFLAQKFGHYS